MTAEADPALEGPYNVVLLVEQALTPADAAQVQSLHEALDDVHYHVLLPMEDAAGRIEAAMGSLAGGEALASPAMVIDQAEIEAVRRDCHDRSQSALDQTLQRLRDVGADVEGQLITGHPVDALAETLSTIDGQEAIILTRPHVVAEFFHVDWTSQARRKLGVPVLHLLEHDESD
ncbi:hypothetical protein [Nocardioides limicola]|uniref:hypothetical protein n=1 Tax=Nocardioides limicola TaxID=2803368 RepID=UPI0027DC5CC9|nr:hypothetical protein [Nocardioides sp. DJM-14]